MLPTRPPPARRRPCPPPEVITDHPFNNVTDAIFQKIGVNLHQQPTHPIGIIKGAIYDYFDKQVGAALLLARTHGVAPARCTGCALCRR